MPGSTATGRSRRAGSSRRCSTGTRSRPGWQGDDRDFAEACCAAHIRVEVRKKLREYKAAGEDEDEGGSLGPAQGRLPGFEHLQLAYLVDRPGEDGRLEPVIVPIGLMSEPELTAKAAELEGMAQGCLAHAEELRRYSRDRTGPVVAAAE